MAFIICQSLQFLFLFVGVCRPGWAGPANGDLGGELQGHEACVKVLQNNGNHYKGRDACRYNYRLFYNIIIDKFL